MQHIYAKLQQVGDCWEWQGLRQKYGHGEVYYGGRTMPAYRVIYEDMVGPVPDGLELDHLCRNPPCCNPYHLDPVTHAVNMARGVQSFDTRSVCQRGHELTPDNVGINQAIQRRFCRACKNAAKRRSRARAKERAL